MVETGRTDVEYMRKSATYRAVVNAVTWRDFLDGIEKMFSHIPRKRMRSIEEFVRETLEELVEPSSTFERYAYLRSILVPLGVV